MDRRAPRPESAGVIMHDKQKKSPDAVTTRTGQNSRNSQTAGTKIITPSDLDEQLSDLEALDQKK